MMAEEMKRMGTSWSHTIMEMSLKERGIIVIKGEEEI
jgi:hypothetical protein